MIENDLEPVVGKTISDAAWGGDDPETDSFFYIGFEDGSRLVVTADFIRHAAPLRAIPTLNTWLRMPEELQADVAGEPVAEADTSAEG